MVMAIFAIRTAIPYRCVECRCTHGLQRVDMIFTLPVASPGFIRTGDVHIIRLPELTNGSPPMSYITTVIQACIDSGMYVIVDWHDCTANANAANASAFFKTIATSYHTYPNILYEPWNEPSASGGPSWSGVIKPYMETVIAAIRAIDPNNIVICGNPQWDQLPQNAAADPITDYKNIAYSMHFYSGSHSESGFGPGISTAMSKGCAVFITEYGACNTGTVAAQPQCTQWYHFP